MKLITKFGVYEIFRVLLDSENIAPPSHPLRFKTFRIFIDCEKRFHFI